MGVWSGGNEAISESGSLQSFTFSIFDYCFWAWAP